MQKEFLSEEKYRVIRILLIIASLCALSLGIALLLVPIREFIIVLAETFIVRRSINHEFWHTRLVKYAIMLFIISGLFFCVYRGNTLEKIANIILKNFEVKKLLANEYVSLLVVLCLFLFFYLRVNINIMPVIVCWIVCRLGFADWLSKTFGNKEAKTALIISGVSIIFFISVMMMFRLAIVMNWFFGSDSNRVFGDFTQVSANHYRVKVHPFYVLIWQSIYHLFCPLVNKTSLAIRIMVCVFAGLNIGVFSLFISRLAKSKVLNIIMCTIMAFSFPQILHGSQMLEAYIFTQFSIMLALLYFSFAFFKKEYNLPVLLALSLFISGNNIAYTCIFAIFYIVLLYHTSDSWKTAWNKILKFSVWFAVVFSVLLFIQWLFYGRSSPSNIYSMIKGILSEEGSYIAAHPISWMDYAKNFFGVILFQYLPLNIGAIFEYGWLWALLLLIPILCFKKITHKPLFLAVIASCLFLFVFHRFYGIYELPLYSPMIMCVYVSMFAFIIQILPKKITMPLYCMLLAVMICINAVGTYSLYSINQYIFGSADVTDWKEYEASINKLKERIADYKGNRFLFFKTLKTESWPVSPLHDEILRAYENSDIIPQKIEGKFAGSFGLDFTN